MSFTAISPIWKCFCKHFPTWRAKALPQSGQLYGRSPVGVKYDKLDPRYLSHGANAIDEATAAQLQQVAQDVVTEFFQRK